MAKKACSILSRLFFINLNPATSYFPTPERCSIIGSNRLNFRVRDGNGCDPVDKITGKLFRIFDERIFLIDSLFVVAITIKFACQYILWSSLGTIVLVN